VNTSEQIDGTAVVAVYFEDRIGEAQKAVAECRAALAAAETKVRQREAERDAFTQDGALPPGVPGTMALSPEWELCQWAQLRLSAVSWTDRSPANDALFDRRQAEATAAHGWLEEHGYTLPDAFRGNA
jgi:hypothetical protein